MLSDFIALHTDLFYCLDNRQIVSFHWERNYAISNSGFDSELHDIEHYLHSRIADRYIERGRKKPCFKKREFVFRTYFVFRFDTLYCCLVPSFNDLSTRDTHKHCVTLMNSPSTYFISFHGGSRNQGS